MFRAVDFPPICHGSLSYLHLIYTLIRKVIDSYEDLSKSLPTVGMHFVLLCPETFKKEVGMKGRSGFTLMEMMVVIAVIGILSGISIPPVINWMQNAKFNSAVRDVQSSIEDIRLYAVKENAQAVIKFTDGTNIFRTDKWNRGINTHQIQDHQLLPGVRVFSDFTDDQLIFNSRGMPNAAGTITVKSSIGQTLRINVSLTGNNRIS